MSNCTLNWLRLVQSHPFFWCTGRLVHAIVGIFIDGLIGFFFAKTHGKDEAKWAKIGQDAIQTMRTWTLNCSEWNFSNKVSTRNFQDSNTHTAYLGYSSILQIPSWYVHGVTWKWSSFCAHWYSFTILTPILHVLIYCNHYLIVNLLLLKLFLLEAEFFYLQEDHARALACYNAAIKAARDHRFIHEEGLACEKLATFLLQQNRYREAMAAFADAKLCYESWRAHVLVKRIEKAMEQLMPLVTNTVWKVWREHAKIKIFENVHVYRWHYVEIKHKFAHAVRY